MLKNYSPQKDGEWKSLQLLIICSTCKMHIKQSQSMRALRSDWKPCSLRTFKLHFLENMFFPLFSNPDPVPCNLFRVTCSMSFPPIFSLERMPNLIKFYSDFPLKQSQNIGFLSTLNWLRFRWQNTVFLFTLKSERKLTSVLRLCCCWKSRRN